MNKPQFLARVAGQVAARRRRRNERRGLGDGRGRLIDHARRESASPHDAVDELLRLTAPAAGTGQSSAALRGTGDLVETPLTTAVPKPTASSASAGAVPIPRRAVPEPVERNLPATPGMHPFATIEPRAALFDALPLVTNGTAPLVPTRSLKTDSLTPEPTTRQTGGTTGLAPLPPTRQELAPVPVVEPVDDRTVDLPAPPAARFTLDKQPAEDERRRSAKAIAQPVETLFPAFDSPPPPLAAETDWRLELAQIARRVADLETASGR